MKIVCCKCGLGPKDGVELRKVRDRFLCVSDLATDLIGIKLFFELRRAGHAGCQGGAAQRDHRQGERDRQDARLQRRRDGTHGDYRARVLRFPKFMHQTRDSSVTNYRRLARPVWDFVHSGAEESRIGK